MSDLANTYAHALLTTNELLTKKENTASIDWLSCIRTLDMIFSHPQIQKMYTQSHIDPALIDTLNHIVSACLPATPHPAVMAFITWMIRNQRIHLLPWIAQDLQKMEPKACLDVSVTSAWIMTERQQTQVQALLSHKLKGQTLSISYQHNPHLSPGFIVRFNDYMIDCTSKHTLNAFSQMRFTA